MNIPKMKEIFKKIDEATAAGVAQIMEKLAAGGSVKSVQRGTVVFNNGQLSISVAINEVDPEKAIIVPCGTSGYRMNNYGAVHFELQNGKTVIAKRYSSYANDDNVTAAWQVVEFY